MNRNSNKGFSLVELLAVVLVLSALAAIAIPLYASQRQSAQARVCIANIAAISASCSAYALRLGAYPTSQAVAILPWTGNVAGGLVGAPEGLAAWPACPSTGAAYTYTVAAGVATIQCPNIATHGAYGPARAQPILLRLQRQVQTAFRNKRSKALCGGRELEPAATNRCYIYARLMPQWTQWDTAPVKGISWSQRIVKLRINSGYRKCRRGSNRGAAMIIALALVLVLTMLVAGTAMVSEVQLSASKTERNYERALMMAEAGVNAYVNMLENGAGTGANAAYIPPVYTFTATSPAPTLSQFRTGVLNGTYTVVNYPANSQQGYFIGQTAGAGGTLLVSGYGWSNGVVRRASVTATPSPGSVVNGYALFAGNKGSFNGSANVTGSIGTNGVFGMNGSNNVSQSVVFNGAGSGWSNLNGSNSFGAVINNSTAVAWPTVETLANQAFPLGGLGLLALVNDNLLSLSAFSNILLDQVNWNGSGTVTFNSKVGGANYYITSMNFNGSYNIFFNNTLGPINLWIGPSGGIGRVTLNGASSAVSMSSNPAFACKIYDASNGNITLNGSSTLNIGIYSINNGGTSQVTLNGSAAVNTSIIANAFNSNGSSTINYQSGYFAAPATGNAYTSSGWTELD